MLGFQPPAIGDEEIAAVTETLRSGWLTTGPRTAELEERFAEYVGAEHVLAVASGTAALHLSLLGLGVGPGDEVITSPITWPATANVIVHTGATPVFADVRDSISTSTRARRRARHREDEGDHACPPRGPDVRPRPAVRARAADHRGRRARRGERVPGRKIGALSEATCFSLYATKNIAAGEGGLISTNDSNVADTINDLRIMRRMQGLLYDIAVPGYKANLSDVLASIALVQLGKVEKHREIRQRQFAAYDAAVAELEGLATLARDPRDTHALHLYVIRVDPSGQAAHVTTTARGSSRRTSPRASTSCRCTS